MPDQPPAAAQPIATKPPKLRHRRPRKTYLAHRPALELAEMIKTQKLNPKNLHRPDRLNIVDMLRLEGWGQAKIADLLKCSHRTVKRDIRCLKEHNQSLVKDFTAQRVAGDTIAMADGLRQKAIAKGDYGLAWQITKELTTVIQSLGLLYKAPERFVGSMTLAELVSSAAKPQADDPTRAGGVNRLPSDN